ncbi:MAG: hypothetical protein ACOCVC_07950 [Spirochaeta sp.]
MKPRSNMTAYGRLKLMFVFLIVVLLMLTAACEPSRPDSLENDEGTAAEEIEEPIEQEPQTMSPLQFAEQAQPVEWEGLQPAEPPIWTTDYVHIGTHPPFVLETEQQMILVLHSVDGVLGLDGSSGELLWQIECSALEVRKSRQLKVQVLTRAGYQWDIDPLDGEVDGRTFVGWSAESSLQEWPDTDVRAQFSPVLFSIEKDSITAYMAEQEPESPSEPDPDAAQDFLDAAALEPEGEPILVEPMGEPVTIPFFVEVSGSYEMYVGDFEDSPVLISVVDSNDHAIAENQDYGGLSDGYTVDLEQDTLYELRIQPVPETPHDIQLRIHVALLREGQAPSIEVQQQ